MTLETKDKGFNAYVKYTSAFIGMVVAIILATNWIVSKVKTELSKEINVAINTTIASIVYEVNELKPIKKIVIQHDKAIDILTYRIDAMEGKAFKPHISKEFEKPEETEPVTIKDDK